MLSKQAVLRSRAAALAVNSSRSRNDFELKQRYLLIRAFFNGVQQPETPKLPKITSKVTYNQTRSMLFNFLLLQRRNTFSTESKSSDRGKTEEGPHDDALSNRARDNTKSLEHQKNHLQSNEIEYPSYIRRLMSSLPPLHRPTRDEMLSVATGFWERLKIRFKWFTIRGFRKFNTDDMSAFLSWFVVSQAVWIMVGTTTFFSVIFATLNSLRMQEFVAHKISDYLTRETGWTVVFESAIVPKWKDGQISFKRTYISRHPDLDPSLMATENQPSGHPAHNAATRLDAHLPTLHHEEDEHDGLTALQTQLQELPPEKRITTFDLEVDSVDVVLSLRRWLDGKGLIESAIVKGVRGIVDRRLVPMSYDSDLDYSDFRHPDPGFELESLQIEDVLVTVYQPDFRPYTASIFHADFRLLRKQWLFYDLLSAKSIVGQFDNCLFSLHEPQSIGRTFSENLKDSKWKRMSRLRIDGVNVDHLQAATGSKSGPISWIISGKVDAVLDIKFPREESDDVDISALLNEIAYHISVAASNTAEDVQEFGSKYIKRPWLTDRIPGQRELAKPPLRSPRGDLQEKVDNSELTRDVVVDIDLRFRDVKAAVPLFTKDLSYTKNALVRPIVAFINANKTLIPIHCTVVKSLSDFDGSWTAWETGLTDAIADQVYDALAYHVTQANLNRRIKAVSAWSLQMTAQAVINALRNIVDPISVHIREVSSDEQLYLG